MTRVAILIYMPTPPEYHEKLHHQRRSTASTSTAVGLPTNVELPPLEFGIATVPIVTEDSEDPDSASRLELETKAASG